MAWETRARGGRYYTRSHRQNGRIVREYLGSGAGAEAIASVYQITQELNQTLRSQARAEEAAWNEVRGAVRAFSKAVESAAREALEDAGYHRHDRGQWRKKRMPRVKTKRESIEEPRELLTQEQQDVQLIARARTDSTVPRWQIQETLDRMKSPPRSNLKGIAEDSLVMFLSKDDPVKRECMRREIDKVRREAAGPDPSPLETLLADRVAICWAHVQVAETLYTAIMGLGRAETSLVHHKRIEACQRRYLSAIKTLAQVRRLQLPCVQVNIGQTQNIAENQVNINGQAGQDHGSHLRSEQ